MIQQMLDSKAYQKLWKVLWGLWTHQNTDSTTQAEMVQVQILEANVNKKIKGAFQGGPNKLLCNMVYLITQPSKSI